MMKKFGLLTIVLVLAASAHASYTVATFSNPSSGSDNPLFWVDWIGQTIEGGWDQGGLVLDFPWIGSSYNAWFEMEPVAIVDQVVWQGDLRMGLTGEGVINFYEDGTQNLLLSISFSRAYVDAGGFWSHLAMFSSPLIAESLSDEQFSFAFANTVPAGDGFSATAAFDSSAIPEPATLFIFAIGSALCGLCRRL